MAFISPLTILSEIFLFLKLIVIFEIILFSKLSENIDKN
jgi:Sec-independent protein secretion pathway component TatC